MSGLRANGGIQRCWVVAVMMMTSVAYAQPGSSGVVRGLTDVAEFARMLLVQLCLLGGAGFLLTGIYQYTQYRKNPSGVKLSTVVTLLLCGLALIVIIFLPQWMYQHEYK